MTGQFGKNHLGDRDEMLPTAHGFDEFFGNLYHLNAEEEPENPDYPKSPEMNKKFAPRGVIHSLPPDGTQTIESTGPLTNEAHGDHRRGGHRPHAGLSWSGRQEGRQAFLPVVELHPHAHLHPPQG